MSQTKAWNASAGRLFAPAFMLRVLAPSRRKRLSGSPLAGIAQEEGADALTVSNTVPVLEPRVSAGTGGLSGRALLDGTLTNVRELRRATGGAMPVNASGGIFSPADALAAIEAGATYVNVHSAVRAGGEIRAQLEGDDHDH